MMHDTALLAAARLRRVPLAMLLTWLACAMAAAADGDPPGRVARVNLLEGSGALQPAGTDDWTNELLNRPLAPGDRIWIAAESRAELHIGSTVLRLGPRTALQILAADDREVRLAVTAGSVNARVRTLEADERLEIETPAGELAIVQPGGYRLDVDDHDQRAYFAVWSGRAVVNGRSGSSSVGDGQAATLTSGNAPSIQVASAGAVDSLDLWAEDRDRREQRSLAASYVSREVVGYEALDGYGDWIVDPVYGPVWAPVVVVGWAPYRYGYWSWIGPWGWTWIADEPWGFAPCHYGRWVQARHGWVWSPGPRGRQRPVFAPALVSWHRDRPAEQDPRGAHARPVGWVPLGYNEIYEPPFRASHEYVRAANLSNTHLEHGDVDRYIDERRRHDTPAPQRPLPVAWPVARPVMRPDAPAPVMVGAGEPLAVQARPAPRDDRPPPRQGMQSPAGTVPAPAVHHGPAPIFRAPESHPTELHATEPRAAPAPAAAPAAVSNNHGVHRATGRPDRQP